MKRKHANVPACVAADMIGPGYLGRSFVGHTVVHIVKADPFNNLALCSKRGEMWDRCIEPGSDRIGYHTYDVCAPCAEAREKIRQADKPKPGTVGGGPHPSEAVPWKR